jgi:hypothetical protein
MKRAVIEDGDGNQPLVDAAGRLADELHQGRRPQFVRLAPLGSHCRKRSHARQQQGDASAGLKSASTV